MRAIFKVIKKGVQVTIQDSGREKYRHLGVPLSGAMDHFAYQIGNLLIGNTRKMASIEIAIGGTVLEALSDVSIVITGANLSPTINGSLVDMYKVIVVNKGDFLSFNGPKSGVYAYVSVHGGINSKSDFDSQSSYLLAGFGLNFTNDTIIYGNTDTSLKPTNIGLIRKYIPQQQDKLGVHFIQSSHYENIPQIVKEAILLDELIVESSNRMGMYLRTTQTSLLQVESNILSEGVTFGTIQLLPNGQPIILLADSQTTGGYITLGTVIYSDLWKIVQLQQGSSFNLLSIEFEEARKRNKKFKQFIDQLEIERNDRLKERV